MKKFDVTCEMIYNGHVIVEAENEEKAIEKVEQRLNFTSGDEFPNGGIFGGVYFDFGEATADYVEEVTE